MKIRRHHNNKGLQQVKSGGTGRALRRIAEKLGLTFDDGGFKLRDPAIPGCPFYGVSITALGIIAPPGHSNRCGLVTSAHAPCGMEKAALAPDWTRCPRNPEINGSYVPPQLRVETVTPAYVLASDGTWIKCSRCGKVSYNLHDVWHLYCGYCHHYHESGEIIQ